MWNQQNYDFENAMFIADINESDIAEIVHRRDGENDCEAWKFVLKMTDGRFAYVSAWCDYTGWDCRSGAEVTYADSLEELVPEMDAEGRMAFGYEPTPDCGV